MWEREYYTRQNKLRVASHSQQCNSIFNKMLGLIPISDCYNNLIDDTLVSDEQFSVKIFFFKKFKFWDLKNPYFNPKSLNCSSLWLIDHFSNRLVKRASINRFFTTFVSYSDSLRFFQYQISPFFFSTLFKKLMVNAEDMQLLLGIRVHIKPSLMFRLSDH